MPRYLPSLSSLDLKGISFAYYNAYFIRNYAHETDEIHICCYSDSILTCLYPIKTLTATGLLLAPRNLDDLGKPPTATGLYLIDDFEDFGKISIMAFYDIQYAVNNYNNLHTERSGQTLVTDFTEIHNQKISFKYPEANKKWYEQWKKKHHDFKETNRISQIKYN